jgi:hypothetical protein
MITATQTFAKFLKLLSRHSNTIAVKDISFTKCRLTIDTETDYTFEVKVNDSIITVIVYRLGIYREFRTFFKSDGIIEFVFLTIVRDYMCSDGDGVSVNECRVRRTKSEPNLLGCSGF